MDLELLAEGHEVRERLAADEPAAVVLGGRERFFPAGRDLKAAPQLSPAQQRGTVDGINRLFLGWYSFPRPVVAAVNGPALAGGVILALFADHPGFAPEGRPRPTQPRAGLPLPPPPGSPVRPPPPAPPPRPPRARASLG